MLNTIPEFLLTQTADVHFRLHKTLLAAAIRAHKPSKKNTTSQCFQGLRHSGRISSGLVVCYISRFGNEASSSFQLYSVQYGEKASSN
jgi:hypothetical protein